MSLFLSGRSPAMLFFILVISLQNIFARSDQYRMSNFRAQEQEESNWCWAAAVSMAANHFGRADLEQCKIVTATRGRDCCGFWTSSSAECDRPGFSDRVAKTMGMNVRVITADAESIPRALKQGYFPILKLDYIGKAIGHVVVIYGSYRENKQLYLEGFDPNYGHFVISANNFILRGNKFGGVWNQSFLLSGFRSKGLSLPNTLKTSDSFTHLEIKDWDKINNKPEAR